MSCNAMHLLSPVGGRTVSSTRYYGYSLSTICARPSGPLSSFGVWLYRVKDKRLNFDIQRRCRAISKSRPGDHKDSYQTNGLPAAMKWREIVEDAVTIGKEARKAGVVAEEISMLIEAVRTMLGSMEDGEISVSAYVTAWVALVKDIEGSGAPQFPSSLEWIANNQLPDGSWGDGDICQAHDRLLNTLACVVALKSWNLHPDKCEKGLAYFRDNLHQLEDENPAHMLAGFEVAFPSLLEMARALGIDIPCDAPVLQEIYAQRNVKLQSIPKETMHKVQTTLLYSLEGMPGLDWEKLLKFQNQDGSFLFSPSSTAYALMQTKDQNCLRYLNRVVTRFNGGVPHAYPIDLFEHTWSVDRLQRLGISRFFQKEIKECISYVNRYWTENGIGWTRNCSVKDIDETAMGFRLLRLHGYSVSPDVFKQFEKDGEFVCYIGQSMQSITATFNLYRASQVLFPGEDILQNAKAFSSNFLGEKLDANEVFDKWIIAKDLPEEVRHALEVPWYASLPRVEARFFIEHYGGKDDVWIAKTLYRIPYVNNNVYLQLAKLDYNNCQALHRDEWNNFQKWYEEYNLGVFGITKKVLLNKYFVATASIFEPERARERLAWAKTTILLEILESYFQKNNNSIEHRNAFIHEFKNYMELGYSFSRRYNHTRILNGRRIGQKKTRQELVRLLVGTINHFSMDNLLGDGWDIISSLCNIWERWLMKWEAEGERLQGEPELLVETILITTNCHFQKRQPLSHLFEYEQLCNLTNDLCSKLGHYQIHKVHDNNGRHGDASQKMTTSEIEHGMQQLVQLVYRHSPDGLDPNIKQLFFVVAKSFYYTAYCSPGTINYHIARVLFERIY